MNYFSLFSGIGSFEKALDRIGVKYKLVNYCEIDKHASKAYAAVHDVSEDLNLGDITQVDTSKLPPIDMISYGFPCQDISLAGKQKGLFNEDGTQTRSGLFFEALRIIEATQPKVAVAENVKNLVSKKFNAQFQIVLESLDQAGYNCYWKILNSRDYGIPQNRERVFIVSIRKDVDTGTFKFPEPFELKLRLKDLLEEEVDEKYYIKGKYDSVTMINNDYAMLNGGVIGKMHDISRRAYSDTGISPTIPTCGGGNTEPKVIVTAAAMRGRYNESGQVDQNVEISDRAYANAITTVQKDSLIAEPSFVNGEKEQIAISYGMKISSKEIDVGKCLTARYHKGFSNYNPENAVMVKVVNGDVCKTVRAGGHGSTDRHSWDMVECNTSLRIRKLTPLECWRLQGFDDEDFYKAEKVCSNTQLYKQAGNSITVDVLEYLFKEIMEVLEVKKVEDKVVVYECEGLINLEALKEKEPELYEELLADYPCEKATYVFKVV